MYRELEKLLRLTQKALFGEHSLILIFRKNIPQNTQEIRDRLYRLLKRSKSKTTISFFISEGKLYIPFSKNEKMGKVRGVIINGPFSNNLRQQIDIYTIVLKKRRLSFIRKNDCFFRLSEIIDENPNMEIKLFFNKREVSISDFLNTGEIIIKNKTLK